MQSETSATYVDSIFLLSNGDERYESVIVVAPRHRILHWVALLKVFRWAVSKDFIEICALFPPFSSLLLFLHLFPYLPQKPREIYDASASKCHCSSGHLCWAGFVCRYSVNRAGLSRVKWSTSNFSNSITRNITSQYEEPGFS